MLLAPRHLSLVVQALLVFSTSLAAALDASDASQQVLNDAASKPGYSKGTAVPVSCLNRTVEDGQHISDASGGLQYIPFPVCNETGVSLFFAYGEPTTQTCTIDSLDDDLYHLLEFYVHNDAPLACRIPSYPLSSSPSNKKDASSIADASPSTQWTPLTFALQGTLQLSHIHLHTSINVLLHSSPSNSLIAGTAYSLPNITTETPSPEGSKVIRGEPLTFTFNIGWIDGTVLPGMMGRPLPRVRDHGIGFFFLCVFACLASAGVGGIAVMQFERRKWNKGKAMDGLLGANTARTNGYSGYGGYGGYSSGKRD